jgi:hypothetical protein
MLNGAVGALFGIEPLMRSALVVVVAAAAGVSDELASGVLSRGLHGCREDEDGAEPCESDSVGHTSLLIIAE